LNAVKVFTWVMLYKEQKGTG